MNRQPSISLDSLKGHLWARGQTHEDPEKKREEALGREWFAITAFPLFAGTFGPIASALNICALVEPWRCRLDLSTLEIFEQIPDPKWFVGINAVSLIFGVVANLAIMFVGSDRSAPLSRYYLSLVLATIVGGLMASILLIVLVIVVSLDLPDHGPPDHAFTEAYFYAIQAAVIYFMTSSFVIYTAYMLRRTMRTRAGLPKRFSKGHRSLKTVTIILMAYILLGATIFSKIEGWRYLDGVFWADVTLLTIGFGDFKPSTDLGRALLLPYTLFGVFLLVFAIYCITRVVFERGSSLWEIRLRDQERIRRLRRREEKKPSPRRSEENGQPSNGSGQNSLSAKTCSHPTQRSHDLESRRRDFKIMQHVMHRSAARRIWYSMLLWSMFLVFLWLMGAYVFYICERSRGWTYFNSVYFTFISLLAIGYGDVTLTTMSGKSFFVLWSLIVVPTLTMLISTGTEAVGYPFLTGVRSWFRRKILGKKPEKIKRRLSMSVDKMAKEGFEGFDDLKHNSHDKNHLMVQAIKRIAKDHIMHERTKERMEYSFEDWEYIFWLMGALDPEFQGPMGEPRGEEEDRDPYEEHGNVVRGRRRNSLEQWRDGSNDHNFRARDPSNMAGKTEGNVEMAGEMSLDWLHGKNPLNVSENLTEWMLLTLVEKLESEMEEMRRQLGSMGEKSQMGAEVGIGVV